MYYLSSDTMEGFYGRRFVMDRETALGIVEKARQEQSCDLAEGFLDDLIGYWAVVEKAFKNIIDDGACSEALEALAGDDDLESAYDDEHGTFLMALMIHYKKDAKAKAYDAEHEGQATDGDGTSRSIGTCV